MGLFSGKSLDTFNQLFLDQLQDLYDAENQLVKALPLMSKAAQDSALKSAFDQHLRETQNQVARLERVFSTIGEKPKGKTCAAMKGLVAEGQEVIDASGDPDVKDAGLIAAAQRVEHYEIAAYGTARTFAQRIGNNEAARLLQETLDEEGATDKRLTQLAESSINRQAVMSAP